MPHSLHPDRHTVSVIGCGYLGATHAAALAESGWRVIGIDPDAAKVATLAGGRAPFFEPGLDELLARHVADGRLHFSTDPSAAAGARIHFLCVGTPQGPDGEADLTYLDAAVDALIPHLGPGSIVVGKSTVPVGTARRLAARVHGSGAELLWNPEFLREGFAVEDSLRPDRIVLGGGSPAAIGAMRSLYAAQLRGGTPFLTIGLESAELTKQAANAFLAMKISFINGIAELAERAGGDVTEIADAIGLDTRIGRRFLNAGIGFGGGCLGKDIRALAATATGHGTPALAGLLGAVDVINEGSRQRAIAAVVAAAARTGGRRVAVLGAAFKPNSDDLRDSPAVALTAGLVAAGLEVRVADPVANPSTVAGSLGTDELAVACAAADVVVLATEWDEYVAMDPTWLASIARGREIVDLRNVLDPDAFAAAGFTYTGVGRPQRDAAEAVDEAA